MLCQFPPDLVVCRTLCILIRGFRPRFLEGNRMRSRLPAALLILSMFAPPLHAQALAAGDYPVLRAAIQMNPGGVDTTAQLVVLDRTFDLTLWSREDAALAGFVDLQVPDTLLDAFISRNTGPAPLEAALLGEAGNLVTVPTDSILRKLGSAPDSFWKEFDARYPGTIHLNVLSKPGVVGDAAIVLVDTFCGPSCHSANYVVLRRRGAEWSVIAVNGRRMETPTHGSIIH